MWIGIKLTQKCQFDAGYIVFWELGIQVTLVLGKITQNFSTAVCPNVIFSSYLINVLYTWDYDMVFPGAFPLICKYLRNIMVWWGGVDAHYWRKKYDSTLKWKLKVSLSQIYVISTWKRNFRKKCHFLLCASVDFDACYRRPTCRTNGCPTGRTVPRDIKD